MLLGFALWNFFIVWFHEGEIQLYEPYAKLLVGTLVAFAFAYHRVNLAYIRIGLYLAAASLIYLYFYEYSGHGRFSDGMNPNKWSPMLLSYAVVALILVFFDKSRSFKVMAFVSCCVFAGMILLAASRSTSLLLALMVLGSALFMVLRKLSFVRVFSFVGFIAVGFALQNYSSLPVEARLKNFLKEFSLAESGGFKTSSGLRYKILKSGLSSVKNNIFWGRAII